MHLGLDDICLYVNFDDAKKLNHFQESFEKFKSEFFQDGQVKDANHYLKLDLYVLENSISMYSDYPFSFARKSRDERSETIHIFDVLTSVWIGRFGAGSLKRRDLSIKKRELLFIKDFESQNEMTYEIELDDLSDARKLISEILYFSNSDLALLGGFLGRIIKARDLFEELQKDSDPGNYICGHQLYLFNKNSKKALLNEAQLWLKQNSCKKCLPCPHYFSSSLFMENIDTELIKHEQDFKGLGACQFLELGHRVTSRLSYE